MVKVKRIYLRPQFRFSRASTGNDDMGVLLHLSGCVNQYVDALFLAQAIRR